MGALVTNFLCQVVDEEFHIGFHRRLSVRMRNAFNADYGCTALFHKDSYFDRFFFGLRAELILSQ
jgi:hypothetical protein